ncbi:MAG: M3 family metallopeptidase [Meiothermus sp.]|nr:M3 family metallopeptidase [Meiothermus sp.]
MSNALAPNPLTSIQFDIPFDQIRPEHVEPAIDQLIAEAEAGLEAIIGVQGPRTYANTLGALDELGRGLWYAFGIVSHLEGVVTHPELRAAYNRVLPKVSAFGTRLEISEGLYRALKDYAATPEAQTLSPARRRFLKLRLDDFRRQGADLPPENKERLEALNTRLSEVCTKFRQNVTDSVADWEIYLDEAQVAGLPSSALEAAAQSAQSKGKTGYRFTLQQPSYIPVMTYLDNAEIRKLFYLAYNSRATEEGRDNRPLIAEILALRQEKAELLGYPNYGDYVLEDRMAGKAEAALKFEMDMRLAYEPHFKREAAELERFAGRPLEAWDVGYWVERQRKALHDFNDELLRPYLPLPQVLRGMFEIFGRVFDFEVREAAGVAVWHPEVRVYEIVRQGRMICRFFTDWHPRETKRGGAWMNYFIVGDRSSGRQEPHLGLMCGNMTAPIGDRPALLTHDEVQTLFHEFGHLLHLALSDVEVRSLGGLEVAWDFVELPSQILENWCWERESLDMFARHYQTGEPIPEALYQAMISARNHWAASSGMRQLSFGTVDLALHNQYRPADGDLMDYARAVMQPFYPARLPEPYGFMAGFTHLFGSPVGYASGYYSYKWSEVLDADAFSRFKREGIFNPQTGADFVANVLSRGNSVDPAEMFRRFMGRDPSPRALLERSGLLD